MRGFRGEDLSNPRSSLKFFAFSATFVLPNALLGSHCVSLSISPTLHMSSPIHLPVPSCKHTTFGYLKGTIGMSYAC